jgi:hypothetical protein
MLAQKRVCLMQFAQGKPIPCLIWHRTTEGDVLPGCELAGEIIARIQMVRLD